MDSFNSSLFVNHSPINNLFVFFFLISFALRIMSVKLLMKNFLLFSKKKNYLFLNSNYNDGKFKLEKSHSTTSLPLIN